MLQTGMKMDLAAIEDFFWKLGWFVYVILFKPLTPGSLVKALREFRLGFEASLAFLIIVGAIFQLAALSVMFYLVFFHEWGLSVGIAFALMVVLCGIFHWRDKRHIRAERRWMEKHTAPPAPS